MIQHFTESWQQMGHEVVVIHTVNKLFPLIYFLPESVKRLIKSRTTYEVSDYSIVCEKAYKINGIPYFASRFSSGFPGGLLRRARSAAARSIADALQKSWLCPRRDTGALGQPFRAASVGTRSPISRRPMRWYFTAFIMPGCIRRC